MAKKVFSPSEAIFGDGIRTVDITQLGRRIGRSRQTIYNWKRRPETMPLQGFAQVAKGIGMTDEEIIRVIRGM